MFCEEERDIVDGEQMMMMKFMMLNIKVMKETREKTSRTSLPVYFLEMPVPGI